MPNPDRKASIWLYSSLLSQQFLRRAARKAETPMGPSATPSPTSLGGSGLKGRTRRAVATRPPEALPIPVHAFVADLSDYSRYHVPASGFSTPTAMHSSFDSPEWTSRSVHRVHSEPVVVECGDVRSNDEQVKCVMCATREALDATQPCPALALRRTSRTEAILASCPNLAARLILLNRLLCRHH